MCINTHCMSVRELEMVVTDHPGSSARTASTLNHCADSPAPEVVSRFKFGICLSFLFSFQDLFCVLCTLHTCELFLLYSTFLMETTVML